MKHLRFILASSIILAFLTVFIVFKGIYAQTTSCPLTDNAVQTGASWQQNSLVVVHVSTDFNETQFNCIKTAFNNWNAANAASGNASGVYFQVSRNNTALAQIFTTTINGSPAIGVSKTTAGNSYSNVLQVNKKVQPLSDGTNDTALVVAGSTNGSFYTHAVMEINSRTSSCNAFTIFTAHEIGHTMGLDHCNLNLNGQNPCNPDNSVMAAPINITNEEFTNPSVGRSSPSQCDNELIKQGGSFDPTKTKQPFPKTGSSCPTGWTEILGICVYNNITTPTPTPSPSATPTPSSTPWPIPFAGDDELCDEMQQTCFAQGGTWKGCDWGCFSPIVIDINGDGYNLTNAQNGIDFNLTGQGSKDRTSWTSPNSDDAWLVLDRNRNNTIDNGQELFGNFTPQPAGISVNERNGFLALAVYDEAVNGGNADGKIDSQDVIFDSLRLWQDKNHNGISETSELFTLPELDIVVLDLKYKESNQTDHYGNRFKYRAKVWDSTKNKTNRWAWDVFPAGSQ